MCSIWIDACAALTNSKGSQQKAEVPMTKYLSKSAKPPPTICGLWLLNFTWFYFYYLAGRRKCVVWAGLIFSVNEQVKYSISDLPCQILSRGRLCHSYWLCNQLCTKCWHDLEELGSKVGKEYECITTVSVASLAAWLLFANKKKKVL